MQDITADSDDKTFNAAFRTPDGQGIKKRLRRVFMRAIPSIYDRTRHF